MRINTHSNTYHLVMDIAWYGVAFAATSRFLTIYAIRLGAEPIDLTLLTALPALCLLVTSLLSVWWRKHFRDSLRAVFLPTLVMRLSFLLPVFTPLMPEDFQLTWLILSVVLPALPQGISSVVFWGIFREAVEDDQIRTLFGWRNAVFNLTLGASAMLFALFLREITFPLNYQVIFGIAFIASLISAWHLMRIKIRPEYIQPLTQPPHFWSSLWQNRAFIDVAVITLLTHVAFFAVFPLVPLWLANDMGASDRFLIEFGLIELYVGAFISLLAPRLMNRLPFRTLVGLSMSLTALGIGIMVYAPSLQVALLAAVFISGGWTIVSLATQALFTQSAPPESTTAYATVFSQILFFSTGVAPFIGNWLHHSGMALGTVLLIGLALRLFVAVLMWLPIPKMVPVRRLSRQGR